MSEQALLPPKRYLNYAYHHWVERVDTDGRGCGLEVYQWQPRVQKWCLPNRYAQGGPSDHDLAGYRYIGLCPTPPLQPEVEEAKRALNALQQGHTWDKIAGHDRDMLQRLMGEHIFSINP